MGRPTKLTPEMEKTIAEIYRRHWNSWGVRTIHKKIPELYKQKFNKSIEPKDVPGRTCINDYIRGVLKPNLERVEKSGIDKPWSIGCLTINDIPPGALPILLKIYEYRLSQSNHNLTVREALWIGRLYTVIDNWAFLERFATIYARHDHVNEIMNKTPDTRLEDTLLIRYRYNSTEFKESLGMVSLARTAEEVSNLQKKFEKKFSLGDVKDDYEVVFLGDVKELYKNKEAHNARVNQRKE